MILFTTSVAKKRKILAKCPTTHHRTITVRITKVVVGTVTTETTGMDTETDETVATTVIIEMGESQEIIEMYASRVTCETLATLETIEKIETDVTIEITVIANATQVIIDHIIRYDFLSFQNFEYYLPKSLYITLLTFYRIVMVPVDAAGFVIDRVCVRTI